MSGLETKRLFIAMPLASNAASALLACQKELKTLGADVKWVEPQNIHLTLKFLGATPTEKIGAIGGALREASAKTAAVEVSLQELGGFPSLSAPRVIWVGLNDPDGRLRDISGRLEESLAGLGLPKETRPFQAHITLGRVRGPRNRTALSEKIRQLNLRFPKETFVLDDMTLFESRLSSRGPEYTALFQAKLSN